MKRQEIEKTLRDIVSHMTAVSPGEITHSAHIVDDLGLDSLDRVELLMEVEERLGLPTSHTTEDRFETAATFKDLVDAVHTQTAEKKHAGRTPVSA